MHAVKTMDSGPGAECDSVTRSSGKGEVFNSIWRKSQSSQEASICKSSLYLPLVRTQSPTKGLSTHSPAMRIPFSESTPPSPQVEVPTV